MKKCAIITKYDNQNEIERVISSSSNCPTYPRFCEIKTETPLEILCFEECHNAGYKRFIWNIFNCCCCYNENGLKLGKNADWFFVSYNNVRFEIISE